MGRPPGLPFVSLVVTVKNAAATLPSLLQDLESLDWPRGQFELVLVDAFSTDGTWEFIQQYSRRPPYRVMAVQEPGRIGAGRNEGFRLARGDLVAVTDADMRVPPHWIRELVAAMDHPDIGVVGGPNDPATDDLTSRTIGTIPVHGPSLTAVPLVGPSKYSSDYETADDVYACVTRNSLFRKAAFEKAGGFDEFLVVTEDPELNHRILQAGYRLRYRRDAGVRHVHRDTLGRFFRQQRGYAVWQAVVDRKHPALFHAKQAMPTAAALLFLASLGLGFLQPLFWVLAAALGVGAAGLSLFYAARASWVRRDPALLLTLPIFFVAWQLAWVVGFPRGLFIRRPR